MPSKPRKPCAWHKCPNLTDRRYCEEHAKTSMKHYNRYSRDPKTNSKYGSQWRQIRKGFLSAFPLCEICRDEGRLTPATQVHHKKRVRDGGTNAIENLQALCGSCHKRIHVLAGDCF